VHIAGTAGSAIIGEGVPATLNVSAVAGQGGRGQISLGGLGFQIIVVNKTAYLNASDAFWRHYGNSAVARMFAGKWVKEPATGHFASVAQLMNLQHLLGQQLSPNGALTKGKNTTVNGRQVVVVKGGSGGSLYVAASGTPYPIEFSEGARGQLSFDSFDQPVSLTPPAHAIELPKQTGG
jgi:hypothetical protein